MLVGEGDKPVVAPGQVEEGGREPRDGSDILTATLKTRSLPRHPQLLSCNYLNQSDSPTVIMNDILISDWSVYAQPLICRMQPPSLQCAVAIIFLLLMIINSATPHTTRLPPTSETPVLTAIGRSLYLFVLLQKLDPSRWAPLEMESWNIYLFLTELQTGERAVNTNATRWMQLPNTALDPSTVFIVRLKNDHEGYITAWTARQWWAASKLASQPVCQSASQSTSQSVSQPASQPVSRSIGYDYPISHQASQLVSQWEKTGHPASLPSSQ